MPQFTSSTYSRYTGKWLIWTGVFELVLASIFLFFGLTDEILLFGFGLTAAILGITGLALVWFGLRARRSAAEADRIASSGTAGTATITGLTQTGLSLNDQPQVDIELMVSIPGKAPYAARRKEFVPLILLGRLSSGSPLPVKVDPSDPQDVIIDWAASAGGPAAGSPAMGLASWPVTTIVGGGGSVASQTDTLAQVQAALSARGMSAAEQAETLAQVQAALAASGIPAGSGVTPGGGATAGTGETLAQVQAALTASGLPATAAFSTPEQGAYSVDQLRAIIRATGIDGTATIDALADTGETVGDERVYTMQATLHVPGQADRQLPAAAATVPLSAVGKVAIGRTVPIKVAPDNPNLVVFEWELIGADGSPSGPAGPATIV